MNLADKCRLLACYHHATDIPERLASAIATQAEQRATLAEAADEIDRRRLTSEEREAVAWATRAADRAMSEALDAAERGYKPPDGVGDVHAWANGHARRAAVLRALVERLG